MGRILTWFDGLNSAEIVFRQSVTVHLGLFSPEDTGLNNLNLILQSFRGN